LPGLTYNLREVALAGAGQEASLQAPITVLVQGSDFEELERLARRAHTIVSSVPGVRDPTIHFRPGAAEQHWVVDRTRAGDLGVTFGEAAMTLRMAVHGTAVAKFRDGDEDADVRVQLAEPDRRTVDDVAALAVPSRRAGTVRLSEVTRRERAASPATIERLDRQRQITVTANLSGRPLSDVLAEVQAGLDKVKRKPGYSFKFAGEAERMKESFSSLLVALGLAIIFVYLVLASQFESLVHPFTILLSIPMASVGAIALIFLTGLSVGLPAMIGIILLMGLVTKNGILLVDYANQLRETGLAAKEAMLRAGPRRLRPILMTTAAMILGMLPAALGRGEGWEIRVPIAVAVIGGLVTSTLLTLIVVPSVYLLLDRFTTRGRRDRELKGVTSSPA
jgi:HAE1 family hydrophobic/amphiphilic exporter-1